KLIEVSSGREVKTIEHTATVWSVSFSADSQYLATRSDDGTAKLIEVSSGREVKTVQHQEPVNTTIFEQRSQYFATSSDDGTTQLVDLRTLDVIGEIVHNQAISLVAFSNDSQYMATRSGNEVRINPVISTHEVADRLCPRIRRNLSASEWTQYIGDDIKGYRKTCEDYPVHLTVLEF
ncbi:MAG: hypothetical protein AAGD25_32290, partial [Cyanobacteria bacterium P01_F01_bin.150]